MAKKLHDRFTFGFWQSSKKRLRFFYGLGKFCYVRSRKDKNGIDKLGKNRKKRVQFKTNV